MEPIRQDGARTFGSPECSNAEPYLCKPELPATSHMGQFAIALAVVLRSRAGVLETQLRELKAQKQERVLVFR